MGPELAREFTWEAATDRLISASAITWKEAREREKSGWSTVDERIAWFHNEMGKGVKGDIIRKMFGGGPASEQVKYQMEQAHDDEEDERNGLSVKFRASSFAQAVREAVSSGLTTLGVYSKYGFE